MAEGHRSSFSLAPTGPGTGCAMRNIAVRKAARRPVRQAVGQSGGADCLSRRSFSSTSERLVRARAVLLLPFFFAFFGCSEHSRPAEKLYIGVTTSWLECAVKDIAGCRFELVRLLPPGDCPGHFDVSPGTLRQLARCSLLFRFDFQEGLDDRLSGLVARGLRIVPVAPVAGLCVPDSYLEACRQVESALREMHQAHADEFRSHLTSVQKRLSELSAAARARIPAAGLSGRKVVCSHHQSSFCRWLGLEVVAEFSRAENVTSSAVAQVVASAERSGARLVIGNAQEGCQAADAIARRLGVPVVLFSNFPSMESNQERFDDLVLTNVESMVLGANE